MARFHSRCVLVVADVLYRPMTDFGAGPVLTRNFDFDIDRSGGIAVDSGFAELQKDVALIIAEVIEGGNRLGSRTPGSFEEDVRVDVGVELSSDPRIESVERIEIVEDTENRNEVDVAVSLMTSEGEFEDVISVPA